MTGLAVAKLHVVAMTDFRTLIAQLITDDAVASARQVRYAEVRTTVETDVRDGG